MSRSITETWPACSRAWPSKSQQALSYTARLCPCKQNGKIKRGHAGSKALSKESEPIRLLRVHFSPPRERPFASVKLRLNAHAAVQRVFSGESSTLKKCRCACVSLNACHTIRRPRLAKVKEQKRKVGPDLRTAHACLLRRLRWASSASSAVYSGVERRNEGVYNAFRKSRSRRLFG